MSKVIRLSDECVNDLELVREKALLKHGKIINSITDMGLIKLALEWYYEYLLFELEEEKNEFT